MPVSRGIFLAISLFSLLAGCAPKAPADQFTVSGVVSQSQQDMFGGIWFELVRVDQHFIIDTSADPNGLSAILQDSAKTGRSVTVRYDSDGNYPFGADKPSYVVRALTYDGKTLAAQGQDRLSDLLRPLLAPDPANAALARGLGLYDMGKSRPAHPLFETALADPALPANLRILALKNDGNALIDDAFLGLEPGDARDRQLVAALRDFEAWHGLAPDDTDVELEIATALTDLGDYDDALAKLRAVVASKPTDSFWILIRIGGIYRTQEKPALALAALDELTSRLGPQDGMAYHYHRGWTLQDLGRFDEAVAEFTKGLASQPDYAWAFVRRACAHAALGQMREAIADQRRGVALIEAGGQQMTAGLAQDLDRARAVLKTMQDSLAQDDRPKLENLCEGYLDFGEQRRAPSPLLPTVKS